MRQRFKAWVERQPTRGGRVSAKVREVNAGLKDVIAVASVDVRHLFLPSPLN